MSFPIGKKIIVTKKMYEKINALDFETELANKANTKIVCIGTKFGGYRPPFLKNRDKFLSMLNYKKLTHFEEIFIHFPSKNLHQLFDMFIKNFCESMNSFAALAMRLAPALMS